MSVYAIVAGVQAAFNEAMRLAAEDTITINVIANNTPEFPTIDPGCTTLRTNIHNTRIRKEGKRKSRR